MTASIRTGVLLSVLMLLVGSWSSPRAEVFHEDFNGPGLDPTKWTLDVGDGSVVFANGRATLSCLGGGNFPYLTPVSNPFPESGDFFVRVGFRYPEVLSGGNGFGAQFIMHGFGAWQDSQGFLRMAVGELYPVIVSSSIDNNPHVFEWQYVGGVWSAWLDGNFVASDPSDFRPETFFVGHPPEPHPWWTTQEIDFLHIESMEPVPVVARSWGEIKRDYR